MKKQEKIYNRKVLHPLVITINLLLIFVFANAFNFTELGSAQSDDSSFTSSTSENTTENTINPNESPKISNELTSDVCVLKLTAFGDKEFADYLIFMEKNFLNKSKTIDLLELGMARYEKFKSDIVAQLNIATMEQLRMATDNEATAAFQAPGLKKCHDKANEYILDAAKVLQMRAVTTSNIKKATLFVEKYKQINDKLRTLNLDIMKMVNNITTFEQKLPCYLKSCI